MGVNKQQGVYWCLKSGIGWFEGSDGWSSRSDTSDRDRKSAKSMQAALTLGYEQFRTSQRTTHNEKTYLSALALSAAVTAVVTIASANAVDVEAAQALFKKSGCNKCHSIDRTKSGPALKKIALKYRGAADGQARVIKQSTTSPKVKTEQAGEEEHKVIDTQDLQKQENLADWILSQ